MKTTIKKAKTKVWLAAITGAAVFSLSGLLLKNKGKVDTVPMNEVKAVLIEKKPSSYREGVYTFNVNVGDSTYRISVAGEDEGKNRTYLYYNKDKSAVIILDGRFIMYKWAKNGRDNSYAITFKEKKPIKIYLVEGALVATNGRDIFIGNGNKLAYAHFSNEVAAVKIRESGAKIIFDSGDVKTLRFEESQ